MDEKIDESTAPCKVCGCKDSPLPCICPSGWWFACSNCRASYGTSNNRTDAIDRWNLRNEVEPTRSAPPAADTSSSPQVSLESRLLAAGRIPTATASPRHHTLRVLYCLYCPLVRFDQEQSQLRCVVLERQVGPLDEATSVEGPADCPARAGVLVLFDQVPDPLEGLDELRRKAALLTGD